ncbi:zinc finger protein with KRAB and SCAN domains 2 [Trichonephila clavata]|uniref:Zinc finger protein with KRAB and SCAN domains 2 n=1 Tax=Trichonephila clavata TaxID=2740835 RepID=A0A8X6F5T7_TRICU|nr:zinc finger protein with KRAB and SCAN domains 2 [Trichonephila clavata]
MAAIVESARWCTEEIRALINIWGNLDVQEKFDGTVLDSEVYKNISEELKKLGYARTVSQIRSNVKQLKRDYRLQIDKLNLSGSAGAIKFKFFLEMDRILSSKDSTCPSEILETEISGFNLSIFEIEPVTPSNSRCQQEIFLETPSRQAAAGKVRRKKKPIQEIVEECMGKHVNKFLQLEKKWRRSSFKLKKKNWN